MGAPCPDLARGGIPHPDLAGGTPEMTWDQSPGKELGTKVPPGTDLGKETSQKTWDWITPLPPVEDRVKT